MYRGLFFCLAPGPWHVRASPVFAFRSETTELLHSGRSIQYSEIKIWWSLFWIPSAVAVATAVRQVTKYRHMGFYFTFFADSGASATISLSPSFSFFFCIFYLLIYLVTYYTVQGMVPWRLLKFLSNYHNEGAYQIRLTRNIHFDSFIIKSLPIPNNHGLVQRFRSSSNNYCFSTTAFPLKSLFYITLQDLDPVLIKDTWFL
jgi:hypothetical protein